MLLLVGANGFATWPSSVDNNYIKLCILKLYRFCYDDYRKEGGAMMNHMGRIKESIIYIEAHLYDGLTPEEVADHIHLSQFYFYRLFRQVVGTSVKDYIQKRRLSEGVFKWTDSSKKRQLVEIALEVGFKSHSAFSRSFKKSFHLTPSEFYNHHKENLKQIYPPFNFWEKKYEDFEAVHETDYEMVELEPMMAIGMTSPSSLENNRNFEVVHNLKESIYDSLFKSEAMKSHMFEEIGIAYEGKIDTYIPDKVTFMYFRGFKIDTIQGIPKNMVVKKIPGGKYLKFSTISNNEVYEKTLGYIFGHVIHIEELITSPVDTNLIEIFRYDKLHAGGYIEVELYVPVR